MEIHGECDPQFIKVKEVFSDLYLQQRELGSSFAIFKDGKPIVNIWAGHQDLEKTKTWKKDTLVTVYSTTKGVAALCVALAVEKGFINYNEKVATYWPEFGCNGKEDITISMLLSHQAGICSPLTKNINNYYNQKVMAEKLALMKPLWKPGTACGYHSMTFGWLVAELILRVTGKTIGKFFQDEIRQLRAISHRPFSSITLDHIWFVEYEKGDYQLPHNHRSSGFSGILYVDFNEEKHPLTTVIQPWNGIFDDETKMINVDAEEGTLIIMPSNPAW